MCLRLGQVNHSLELRSVLKRIVGFLVAIVRGVPLREGLDEARESRNGAGEDDGCEFGKRPHADGDDGPGCVSGADKADAVDEADDAAYAGAEE